MRSRGSRDSLGGLLRQAGVYTGLVGGIVATLLLASWAAAVDVNVGFYSSASNSASNASSVQISSFLFPDSNSCVYPAMAVLVAIRSQSASQAPTVTSVTWQVGANPVQNLANATAGWSSNNESQRKRTEIWYRTGPDSGSGTVTVNLSGSADVVAEVVAACSVNQSNPVLPAATNQAVSAPTNSANAIPNSTKGGLALDVLALNYPVTQTGTSPLRTIDLAVSVGANLQAYASHYTDPTTNGFIFLQWSLSGTDYWVQSGAVLQPYAPTLVELSDFVAETTPKGVLLSWRTGLEADNLGFRLYREEGGARVAVTPGLIAGSAVNFPGRSLEAGYSYAWLDAAGTAGTRYVLESVDISGREEWHGPVEASGTERRQPLLPNTPLLESVGATTLTGTPLSRAVRAVAPRPVASAKPDRERQNELAAGEAAKITVREDGWYRVTFDQLRRAGFDVSSADARFLQLYTDGVEQAMAVSGGGERPAQEGALEFYGTGVDTPFTDARVYWLVKGTRPGLRVPLASSPRHVQSSEITFPFTREIRERSFYVMGIVNGEKENFWGRFIGSKGVTQTLTVEHLSESAGGEVLLDVALQGLGIPHAMAVELNGTRIGEIELGAWEAKTATLKVAPGVLVEGDNTLVLRTDDDKAYSLFDTVRLTYPRFSRADGPSLTMALDRRTAASGFKVSGFTGADLRVIDLTVPGRPVEIPGRVVSDGAGFAVEVPGLSGGPWRGARVVTVFADGQVPGPAKIEANRPSRWRSERTGADMVIVTASEFEKALAPLVSSRINQGLSVAIVDVEDVFDEFSFGMKSPHALRQFMETARGWETAPRYLLLAGNGTYDPRDYLGAGGDVVPTMHADTAHMEVPFDDWFTDFDGDGVPEVATGRLPAATVAEMENIVAKILARNGGLGGLKRGLFVADAAIGSNFEIHNDEIRPSLPASTSLTEVTVRELGTTGVRQTILDAIDGGTELIHFAGHGSVDHWRSGMLKSSDAASFSNQSRGSLFTVMNCLNGMFDDPLTVSLSKALLNARGGAIAVWSSAGTTTAPDQTPLMVEFFAALSSTPEATLGEAVLRAKAAVGDADVRRSWVLLGDPASKVD